MPSRPAKAAESLGGSCGVLRVLFHIVIAEIVRPDRGRMPAVAQVDVDLNIVSSQVDELPWLTYGAVAADLYAVERHVNAIRFELSRGRPDGSQNSSPVGILPEDSAFEEIATGDRTTDLHCVVLGGRVLDVDCDRMRCSLRISQQLQGKIMTSVVQRGLEITRRSSYAGSAAAHQDHCVVGGHTTVAVYPLEAASARAGELTMKLVGIDYSVGGQDNQHRGQARCEHAGTLSHATDGPTFVGVARLFGDGVGCQDRLGCRLAAALAEQRNKITKGSRQLFHRQPRADQARRTDRNINGADVCALSGLCCALSLSQGIGDQLGGPMGVGEALWPRTGIRPTRVQDHRSQLSVGQDLL